MERPWRTSRWRRGCTQRLWSAGQAPRWNPVPCYNPPADAGGICQGGLMSSQGSGRVGVVSGEVEREAQLGAEACLSEGTPESLERRFVALAREWKTAAGPSSRVAETVRSPAYLQIIGMGPAALPL